MTEEGPGRNEVNDYHAATTHLGEGKQCTVIATGDALA